MVSYHARLVEVTSRLDFLWKQQAERELADMEETRHNNTQLLKNILPDHVARHFLTEERQTDVRMLVTDFLIQDVIFVCIIIFTLFFHCIVSLYTFENNPVKNNLRHPFI